ncbi:MAG: hypothetical protein CMK09_02590 [Ponticaulis sp.]|nr:hypothetical protein [Ponticaulis sp.]|tara:strand:- start:32935 stop:33495 length:561 start_codon:yes stop_codon:yes gene_type:complete
MQYSQKLHQFEPRKTWTLGETELIWEDEKGRSRRIPFTQIRSVRLRYEPTRAERRRFAMRIDAIVELVITSIDYRGIYDFEDQAEDYRNFVTAFHERLNAENSAVNYLSGSKPVSYVMNWILTAWILLMLAVAAVFLVSIGLIWAVVIKLALIIVFLPALFKVLSRNRPSSYDPTDIPERLLPDIN